MVTGNQRLEQIKYVVDNSDDVKINKDKIYDYVDMLKVKENNHYWLNKYKNSFSEKQLILLVFIIESINFCFWKKPYIEKDFDGHHYSRSTAMIYSLLDKSLTDKSFLNIDNLNNLTKDDLLDILGGDNDLPLIDERYNNISETINTIYNKGDKFFDELFNLKSCMELLEYIVTNFPCFNDVSTYKGQEIYFYKRANLLVRDLFEVSFRVKNNIQNIDDLLGCADYVIPKIFRYYGLIEYSSELANIVDNDNLILHNSNFEIEIRANMIYVIELIRSELENTGVKTNSILLDNFIWVTGRNIEGKHHLTETIFY